MIAMHRASLLALALALPAASERPGAPPDASSQALRARCDPSLESMRAGNVLASRPVSEEDRLELQAAQERSPELLEMRAGDDTLTTVLIVVVVVLLILVIV